MWTLKIPGLLCSVAVLVAAWAQADSLAEARRALYKGDIQRAASGAEAYVKTHPASAAGLAVLAQAHFATGRLEQAFQELHRAIELEPENQEAFYFLVKVSGLLSEAELRAVVTMAPESARAHQVAAETYERSDEKPRAEQEYLAALAVNPKLVSALSALGDLYRLHREVAQARSYYNRALAVDPLDFRSLYGAGACFLLETEPRKAVEYLRSAVKVDPRSGPARFALGEALFQTGELKPAIAELEAAFALEPGMQQAYAILGRAYTALGDKERAAAAFRKLSELRAEDARERDAVFQRTARPEAPGGKGHE